jgi:hypothetical protein
MSAAQAEPFDPIFVLDEFRLKTGMLEPFLEAMESRYRPDAEARGQTLIHTWVTPPTTTEGVALEVLLVWRLEGVPGFWRMRSQNSTDEVAAWWSDCEAWIESRTRRFAASPGAMSGFESLGRRSA